MGYGSVPAGDDLTVCAIARRTKSEHAEWRRYRTIVYPGGYVEYTFWTEKYIGEWQNGLKQMFHDNYLFDVDNFNDSLYHRADLQWIRHSYLGKTTRILRENSSNFLSPEWTPLIPTLKDSIWVNKWPLGEKTIYTVFSLVPEGFNGALFEENKPEGTHLVSLWHHKELDWIDKDGRNYVPATTFAFNKFELDTRTEGNVDCIALLPDIINASLSEGYINVQAAIGQQIDIWAGDPSYQNKNYKSYPSRHCQVNILDDFGGYEGKFVIQLFDNKELIDERILTLEPGTPLLASKTDKTPVTAKKPNGMVLIPSGTFSFKAENTDQFIPYPDTKEPVKEQVNAFYIDQYPITNTQYQEFIRATGYHPADTINFLKHWGNEFDSTKCNNASGKTTPVDAYPKGKSWSGVMDLTGNVWQFTNDVYYNGTYYFVIMKGGSYYKPTSSWWYVKGGPQPNTWHQQLLLVAPSFDRNATVGFRCVKDTGD
jgi:gamma-glutamyl hercynylcysteine S-oxide synthase